ncbi:hypothetical protein AALP_AA6G233200 [Arabis alpina]|uniref:Uncharacterized protein n=1 Tax=Arabis alpina TaxID=50452 RepID=A0A087GR73_ARAAL|nr:hypothetical protein AALP_AA6G233200 [Arabis alpina]
MKCEFHGAFAVVGPLTNSPSQFRFFLPGLYPRSVFLFPYATLLIMIPNYIDEQIGLGFMLRIVSTSLILMTLKLCVSVLFQRSQSKLHRPSLEEPFVHSTSHFRVIRSELMDTTANLLHCSMLMLSSTPSYLEHLKTKASYRHSRPPSSKFVHGSRASSELLLSVNKLRTSETTSHVRSPTFFIGDINVGSHSDYVRLLQAFALRIRRKLLHELFHDVEQASTLNAFIFPFIAILLFFASYSSTVRVVNHLNF